MDLEALFPGRFLKAADFRGQNATLRITGVRLEELPASDDKGTRTRGILSFGETKRELVLNRTNACCIAGMFGRETDAWIGRLVTFYPASIEIAGYPEIAIRVRGSPELTAPTQVEIRLPRRKPFPMTMVPTGGKPSPKRRAPELAPDAVALDVLADAREVGQRRKTMAVIDEVEGTTRTAVAYVPEEA